MAIESEFGKYPGLSDQPILYEEFRAPEGFDPDNHINIGGLSLGRDGLGNTFYKVHSHYDIDTAQDIDILNSKIKEGDPGRAILQTLIDLKQSCVVTPEQLSFQFSKDQRLIIKPDAGVRLQVSEIKKSGGEISRNFNEGTGNPNFPEKKSMYKFEATVVHDDLVIENKGVDYGARITTGIKIATLDFYNLRGVMEILRINNDIKYEQVKKIIFPYFKFKLVPLSDLKRNEQDYQMW